MLFDQPNQCFDYMNDQNLVNKLLPFLNEDTWADFRTELEVRPNNEMKTVIQLIYRKCQYTVKKITITDVKSLLNVQGPIMVQSSGIHCIALYNKMIFDTNFKTT